ncbi:hypothetical protein [Candidatus Villigracilis affinis]|uniref:hypothetical protein n=1 Tax=Candidatus Villigracilis affinis TaxID=3140682 RepID=UPI001DFD6B46|nr:hypothetical protein [Anaerolineales bacterium]
MDLFEQPPVCRFKALNKAEPWPGLFSAHVHQERDDLITSGIVGWHLNVRKPAGFKAGMATIVPRNFSTNSDVINL